jgi:5-methyltetrahydrofolate--homocysteine methyltransferase
MTEPAATSDQLEAAPRVGLTVIGENVHATRVIRRTDQKVLTDADETQAIQFVDAAGAVRHLRVSDDERQSAHYKEGRIKHIRMAMRTAMQDEPEAATALAYLEKVVRDQVAAGADYLDLNVDEVSLEPREQADAIRWLVRAVRGWTRLPVAIDSPSPDILAAGIDEAAEGPAPRPMVNSASLERLGALELAVAAGGPIVVTASGESGMPNDADGRVANASRIVELALARDIALERIHVDPLVFPVAVDGASAAHCLAAITQLRERYGPRIHITGGMSNVSFGLPQRQLLNDVFLALAIDAGADSGILDPVANPPSRALAFNRLSRAGQLAVDAIMGADRMCRSYLRAYRAGELASHA